jgi:Cu2+-exporting ATPase
VQLLIDGGQRTVALRDVKPGDHILVKTGQIIPADGYVMSGVSSVDESQLTGEFRAQKKEPEDKVIAGSYVMENPLQIRVTEVSGQTRLSAVLRLLDQARASKPPIAILADNVAQYFIAGVLLVTATTAITWWLIDPDNAFWITLSVLVVTCPCALSLATPTALTAATGYLAKQGFLISHGHVLEGLSQTTHIIFDKTGTLTRGTLTISELTCLSNLSREQCYQIAAAIEAHSEHPIARAFKPSKLSASDIKTVPGCGIEGVVEGELYRLGMPEYVLGLTKGHSPSSLAFKGDPYAQHVLLGSHNGALAWVELSDELRPNCAHVVSELKAMNFQVELLSGDFSEHVHLIAKQLGISKALAKASPRDKMEYIRTLQRQGKKVVMIGDGINDIPVLANADVSIAMTNASDLTKTTADAILLSGELNHLAEAIRCARKCKTIIRQNIGWAILYNLLALPLAAAGWVLPYLAAIGMSGSSLLVVMNALRLNNPGKRLTRDISG